MTNLNTARDCIPYADWPNHSLYDAKNLAMHSRIAWNISKDPSLLDRARTNLKARRKQYDPDALPPFIVEWERRLSGPPQALAAFLVDVTREAILLRHFSPFAGVLTEQERLHILDAFEREIRRVAESVINIDPDIMSGTPVFTGTRVPARSLTDYLVEGYSLDDILERFPTVRREQATLFLELAAETLMADAGYEPLKTRRQDARPDNATSRIINIDPQIVSGTPVFTGTRVPVRTVTDYLAGGYGLDDILENFPTVSREQAVQFIGLAQRLTGYVWCRSECAD